MELFGAFVFGTLIGSFLNVVILRIPKSQSVVYPASHCPSCHTPLRAWHNIPLFSWIFLGAKCAFCKEKISIQYPLIELFSGLLLLFLVYKFGLTLATLSLFGSFVMLLALSAIDIKYQMVPDSLNILAILFAICGAWSFGGVVQNFQNALLFAGGFTLLRFLLSYYLTSKYAYSVKRFETPWNRHYHRTPFLEAMGEGDIMVAAAMGALLGVKLGFVAIFLSALLALPVMLFLQKESAEPMRIAYVPFLAAATLLTLAFDTQLTALLEAWYA